MSTAEDPTPDDPAHSFETSPHLYLFTSLTAGSSHIITATSRLETILKANKIPFRAVDCATNEKARRLWSRRSQGKKLPGLVKNGLILADLVEAEELNEFGELREALGHTGKPAGPGAGSANTDATANPAGKSTTGTGGATPGDAAPTTNQPKPDISPAALMEKKAGLKQAETVQKDKGGVSSLAAEAAAAAQARKKANAAVAAGAAPPPNPVFDGPEKMRPLPPDAVLPGDQGAGAPAEPTSTAGKDAEAEERAKEAATASAAADAVAVSPTATAKDAEPGLDASVSEKKPRTLSSGSPPIPGMDDEGSPSPMDEKGSHNTLPHLNLPPLAGAMADRSRAEGVPAQAKTEVNKEKAGDAGAAPAKKAGLDAVTSDPKAMREEMDGKKVEKESSEEDEEESSEEESSSSEGKTVSPSAHVHFKDDEKKGRAADPAKAAESVGD